MPALEVIPKAASALELGVGRFDHGAQTVGVLARLVQLRVEVRDPAPALLIELDELPAALALFLLALQLLREAQELRGGDAPQAPELKINQAMGRVVRIAEVLLELVVLLAHAQQRRFLFFHALGQTVAIGLEAQQFFFELRAIPEELE